MTKTNRKVLSAVLALTALAASACQRGQPSAFERVDRSRSASGR